MKIKKEDNVIVLSGKDKGKSGKVLQSMPREDKVVVKGVNIKKRHVRPRKQGEKGQIIEVEAPMHVSNVMLICSKCGKPTRVGYKLHEGGKSRICKKCNSVL